MDPREVLRQVLVESGVSVSMDCVLCFDEEIIVSCYLKREGGGRGGENVSCVSYKGKQCVYSYMYIIIHNIYTCIIHI